jgi:hypothetical protein
MSSLHLLFEGVASLCTQRTLDPLPHITGMLKPISILYPL